MKKNILFVIGSLNLGGAERSLVNLIDLLDKNLFNIDLLIIFNNERELIDQLPDQVNVLEPSKELSFLSSSYKHKSFYRNFSIKKFFEKILFSFREKKGKSNYYYKQLLWEKVWKQYIPNIQKDYDTAVGFMHSIPSYFVIDKVKARKKILWVHSDYSKLKADIDFDKKYFEKADKIVTISKICEASLRGSFPNISEKFTTIYNLNSSKNIWALSEKIIPKEFNIPSEKKIPIILSVGGLKKVKGYDLAIKAASILKNKKIKFIWFILGEGSQRDFLSKLIFKYKLTQNVFLLGLRRNPYPYMKNCDLVVQTSRCEGKSLVIDEAKILKKPILSTKYNSVTDQIEDGKTGILVDQNPEKIADGIINLLKNKELRDKLSSNLSKLDDEIEKELKKYTDLIY